MKTGKNDLSYVVAAAAGLTALFLLVVFGLTIRPSSPSQTALNGEKMQIVSDGSFGDIVFNEMLLSNDKFYPDGSGNFYDYAEIRNMTDRTVDISDWYITEDKNPERNDNNPERIYSRVFLRGRKRRSLLSDETFKKRQGNIYYLYKKRFRIRQSCNIADGNKSRL